MNPNALNTKPLQRRTLRLFAHVSCDYVSDGKRRSCFSLVSIQTGRMIDHAHITINDDGDSRVVWSASVAPLAANPRLVRALQRFGARMLVRSIPMQIHCQ